MQTSGRTAHLCLNGWGTGIRIVSEFHVGSIGAFCWVGGGWQKKKGCRPIKGRGDKSGNDKPSRWSVRGWSEFDEGDQWDDTKRRGEWNCVFLKHIKVIGMKETMWAFWEVEHMKGGKRLDSTCKEAETLMWTRRNYSSNNFFCTSQF